LTLEGVRDRVLALDPARPVDEVIAACEEVTGAAELDGVRCAILMEHGACDRILSVLQAHSATSTALVLAAFRFIAAMAERFVPTSLSLPTPLLLQHELVQRGALELVVSIMQQYNMDAPVQASACATLQACCERNPAHKQRATEAGGLDAILFALHVHRTDAQVQGNALDALNTLIKGRPDNKQVLSSSDGIKRIDAAMRAHPQDPVVEQRGVRLILQLMRGHPANRKAFIQLKTAALILRAMMQHPSFQALQEDGDYACRILGVTAQQSRRNKEGSDVSRLLGFSSFSLFESAYHLTRLS
jgi:hypothetical protein